MNLPPIFLKGLTLSGLLTTAPKLAGEVRHWYETLRKPPPDPRPPRERATPLDVSAAMAQLGTRIEGLEATVSAQAEFLARMVAQEEALARGLRAVSRRVTLLLLATAAALLFALAAVVLALT